MLLPWSTPIMHHQPNIRRLDMSQAGDELSNTLAEKQRIILRTTAAETGGALLEMEAYYKPGGHYPPEHYHPLQDEHFEVLKGQIDVCVDGVEHTYAAGEAFAIPRCTAHTFRNGGAEEAAVLWQVRPALRTQQFYETLWGLAADGKTNTAGIPHLLQLAVLLQEYAAEFVLTSPPRALQPVLFGALAVVGRLRGYRGHYERYSGPRATATGELQLKRHTAQAHIWIDRPVDEVFRYVASYDNDIAWRNVVLMTQTPAGAARPGTITREEIDLLGKRYTTTARVTAVEPARRLIWEALDGAYPLAGSRATEARDGGTLLTVVVTADMGGVARLFAPLLVRALRSNMRAELAALKLRLEDGRAADQAALPSELA
jgi:quercetin dioxygenase-like cupin family protein/uncharacterized membrane protein